MKLDKKLVDNYIMENGTIDCNIIMKAEAQKHGISEEFCHPITKGMAADYILVYLSGERSSFIKTLIITSMALLVVDNSYLYVKKK